ncbi:MAG: AAA family ATPase [candidate division KSB1 bacterium]|nr:AAA family ATPase [candidate division KSB1 bacterium]MDZ7369482.1 AAA family ATPase [candidate division KSB1 bacterium]MDZ7407588.1 AAA family ATPase [candidate division KSB1 bacterium]
MTNTNDIFDVPLEKLRWRCPLESLELATADEITGIIGQERAQRALRFGLQLKAPGYNVYVTGPSGCGKNTLVRSLLNELKDKGPTPPDICYVHNFQRPDEPNVVYLPAGRGPALAQAMEELTAWVQKAFANADGTAKPERAYRQNFEPIKNLVQNRLAELKNQFVDTRLAAYFDQVQTFILTQAARWSEAAAVPSWTACKINVVVDNSQTRGAPVIIETAPTYTNLFGTIGRAPHREGWWQTDFMQIKAGALARANGGYLVFNLTSALSEPGVWRMLKRTLRHRRLEIQAHDPLAPNNVSLLRPEPIALEVKVVVMTDFEDYYSLYRHDGDFRHIFKVRADFDSSMANEAGAHRHYAAFIKKICAEENLLPFDRSAVAAVIEYGVWLAGVQSKISARFGHIADLLREANFVAAENGGAMVHGDDVQRAIEERYYRNRLGEERWFERIRTGRLMIDVDGKKTGQANALMVLSYPDYSFGYPSRVTAAVGMGNAGIINIEREADLSGKTHNKGVAIVAGYLRGKYAHDKPLSMSASIAFEQSGTSVDGDSASVAEVCVILSALSGLPLRQDLAVTGSMNQKGEIQGIGGVNEKIEGFFNACRDRGLTATQGVIIPQLNVEDLMLRQEVIDAIAAGKFHVYAVKTIDECLELLTGVPAGEQDAEGKYPEGTLHYKVDQRLRELNKEKRDNKTPDEKKDEKSDADKKESAKPA